MLKTKVLIFSFCPNSLQMCLFFHIDSSITAQVMEHTYFRFVSGLPILMACVAYDQLQRLRRITKPKLKEGTVYPECFLSFIFLMKANVNSFFFKKRCYFNL